MSGVNHRLIERVVRQALARCLADSGRPVNEPSAFPGELFVSPEVRGIKEEIVRVGKKLWAREYVDGNGGNISCRVSPHYVVCTPTLCSKADIREEDLSLVTLDNHRVIGEREHTSEIRLHLEIYKAVPAARAVVHCHPPHATAYAITGQVPPGEIVPEVEVFVGPVALAPYETPGTTAFAETILPYVRRHNTMLLANHGIVCWADTVTHAEWYVEVVETYCRTILLASMLGKPLKKIPKKKVAELLKIKQTLGLADARLPVQKEAAKFQAQTSVEAPEEMSAPQGSRAVDEEKFDALVAGITEQVIGFLNQRS